jgi:23S rRNA pseudouridine2604 synthase
MSEPQRLSKRLIELCGCSRREAELFIAGGWVTVDGEVIDEPQFKVGDQRVELLPGATPTPLEPVTLLLHRPSDFHGSDQELLDSLGAAQHWPDDASGVRPLKGHFARLTPGPALQPDAGGLLVFTQDWRTTRKLKDDASKLEQEYLVEVTGEMPANGLDRLKRGYTSKGRALPPCKVSWQSENRLRFAMKNPEPGLIRLLCDSVGLHIVSMRRLRLGGVSMGKLPAGQWRYLGAGERF